MNVDGPGVAVDLQDQFGKVDRDLRRAKINLHSPTEPCLVTVLTLTAFGE